jgi:hypothetical protein
MSEEINFSLSPTDRILIGAIIDRIDTMKQLAGEGATARMSLSMDLAACHLNGCPLRLYDLSNAEPHNLAHDVFGISNHIDRSTGKLTQCFRPRYALK